MDDPKMVPESDLIALKGSHEAKIKELTDGHQGEITRLTGEHTTTTDGLRSQIKAFNEEKGRLNATIAQLEEAGKNHATTSEELETVKGQLKEAKDSLEALQGQVTGDLRKMLVNDFNIKEEALEGKSLAELRVVQDALASTKGPNSASYTTGGGTGGEPKLKGRELIKKGLEQGDLKPA